MVGPRLQACHPQPAQQLTHGPLMHLNLEPGLDLRPQVHAAPAHNVVLGKVRPGQDQGLQLPHLLAGQRRGAALVARVPQALNAVRVVAVDPVAQGLPVHAARLRRKQTWVPIQDQRQRQQPPGLLGVRRARRRRAQPRAVQIIPRDCNQGHAAYPQSSPGHIDSHPKQLGNPPQVRVKGGWYNVVGLLMRTALPPR